MSRQKPDKPCCEQPSAAVHEVCTPQDIRNALAQMPPQPKTGDWRPDIIGADKLSIQPGMDGLPLINGHRVTREMCAELQAELPHQAHHFNYDDIVAMAKELGPPDLSGLADMLTAAGGGYTGLQLDHQDGNMSCSHELDCREAALPHRGKTDCNHLGPCAHCDGPPVT